MPISVGKDESQDDFMSRCMSHFKHDSDRDYGHEQAIAACLSIWRKGEKAHLDQSLRKSDVILIVPLAKSRKYSYPEDEDEIMNRSDRIGRKVKADYGHEDGDDLAFTLMQRGTIDKDHSDDHAARIVAQHLEQP